MFDMIAFHIFDWGSLRTMATALLPEKMRGPLRLLELKVTRVDSITVVVVAIVSIFTNLAVPPGKRLLPGGTHKPQSGKPGLMLANLPGKLGH